MSLQNDKIIIISDYDGGFARSVYKDGEIHKSTEFGRRNTGNPALREIYRMWIAKGEKVILEVYPDYTLFVCVDGDIKVYHA